MTCAAFARMQLLDREGDPIAEEIAVIHVSIHAVGACVHLMGVDHLAR